MHFLGLQCSDGVHEAVACPPCRIPDGLRRPMDVSPMARSTLSEIRRSLTSRDSRWRRTGCLRFISGHPWCRSLEVHTRRPLNRSTLRAPLIRCTHGTQRQQTGRQQRQRQRLEHKLVVRGLKARQVRGSTDVEGPLRCSLGIVSVEGGAGAGQPCGHLENIHHG